MDKHGYLMSLGDPKQGSQARGVPYHIVHDNAGRKFYIVISHISGAMTKI